MSNEQKAQEIARSYPMPPSNITTSDVVSMIENAALQMAEWKDDEYLKLVNSKKEFACDKIKEYHDKQKRIKYEGMRQVTIELAKECLIKFHEAND